LRNTRRRHLHNKPYRLFSYLTISNEKEEDMADRKYAPGQKMMELRNALHEIDEQNRIGKVRTLPPEITRERLAELALIDTDPDVALPKWQRQQTRQRIISTKEYQSMSFDPRSLPSDCNIEVEVGKGLRRFARREDIEVHPELRRQRLQKMAHQWHGYGQRLIVAVGDAPEKQELSLALRQAEEILERLTGNGQQRLPLDA
jgi:hypothetical protein